MGQTDIDRYEEVIFAVKQRPSSKPRLLTRAYRTFLVAKMVNVVLIVFVVALVIPTAVAILLLAYAVEGRRGKRCRGGAARYFRASRPRAGVNSP